MNKKFISILLFASSQLLLSACSPSGTDAGNNYSKEILDYLAISNPNKLSAASKRALEREYYKHQDWFGHFYYKSLTGDFEYDPSVTRRDPSKVLLIDDVYYTWYTRTTGRAVGFGSDNPEDKVFPWDKSEIWYATSKDGWDWQEQGVAVKPGSKGNFDDRSVFTPEVLAHNSQYYLVYQAVKAPYTNRVKNTVAMAVADSPKGPWKKLDAPILKPADNGVWLGDKDNRFHAKIQGDFDSHKVHDPTLIFYRNKFYLYYKGERMGERVTAGGREIRWGVAIADKAEGPYIKSDYNPITHSGHELALWQYKDGIALVHSHDGPEKKTIQYAEDGINFEIRSYIPGAPSAMGLVESLDKDAYPTAGLKWGLYHKTVIPKGQSWLQGSNYIQRFEFGPRNNDQEFAAKNKAKSSNKDKD